MKSMYGVWIRPRRTNEPFGSQSSRFNWPYAYLSRNVWEPAAELPVPVSLTMSGVTRKAKRWERLPVTLTYARVTSNAFC
jgi:hypothetical protein